MFAKRLVSLAGTMLALALAPAALAQDFDLSWHTIDGGGEMFTAGGDFELSGTIGQPDAGAAMTGGDFTLTGGFWAGAATPPEPCFGSLDGDQDIDFDDLNVLLAAYDTMPGDPGYNADADLDGDDDVDFDDLNVLLSVYGTACP